MQTFYQAPARRPSGEAHQAEGPPPHGEGDGQMQLVTSLRRGNNSPNPKRVNETTVKHAGAGTVAVAIRQWELLPCNCLQVKATNQPTNFNVYRSGAERKTKCSEEEVVPGRPAVAPSRRLQPH
ncbi:hypothetical protein N1851_029243 [Merluccius polli]|uniref:Uncharacterized protein n=1 Tax=Merluccius polli TaxID=89951 RepID=A0AA47NRQ4_MERPO|nr:hypothetical protein N1851_029243 [Merluccius polli]